MGRRAWQSARTTHHSGARHDHGTFTASRQLDEQLNPPLPARGVVIESQSDALVFYGATGDLAYKKIFPALLAMVKHRHLDVPIIGVAKAGWTLDQLRARARDSIANHLDFDEAAFSQLSRLLRYVDGDYNDSATFDAIVAALAGAQRAAHYLAIPPALFATVVRQLGRLGGGQGARVIV